MITKHVAARRSASEFPWKFPPIVGENEKLWTTSPEMNRDNVINALQATTVGDNQKVESFLDEVGFAFLFVL
ncbi:hypothetical protein Y032_0100g3300 [Ancylostoma ceylanicum]|uniref:Uncharacterized protein n=1 Tax=Ancylostoma ceylanicum TaxID=53326 RepID=A0A016TID3_9BILA|nr:hypothetical protein Y032_0100g3300 [Ancylostoma ceylanicum]